MLILFTLGAVLSLTQHVHGWGNGTHAMIGYLADRYLLTETVFLVFCSNLTVESLHHSHVCERTQLSQLLRQCRELGRSGEIEVSLVETMALH